MEYDLVIAGGRVLDPSQGIDRELDVGFLDGRIAALGNNIGPSRQRLDARGRLVTPGLVDMHDHFFHGTGFPQMDPRRDLIPTGVTCAADAGSSGAANFTVFREYLLDSTALHLYAWLNIEVLGLTGHAYPRARSLEVALVEEAVAVIEANRDLIVGVKVLAPSAGPESDDGPELVRRAVEAAGRTDTQVLCHVDGGTDLDAVLRLLRPGDIVSHCYHGHPPHILDGNGRVRTEVWSARRRGVLFDVCPCGGHHLAWSVAEAAAVQGFLPDLIGTDYVHLPAPEVSYPIADCMSIMLGLGMPLSDIVTAVTSAPARALRRESLHGSLAPGRLGDVTVLAVEDAPVSFRSQLDGVRHFDRRIHATATILGGTLTEL